MRGLVAVVLATSVFASAVSAAPLAAGKPAGVKQAQMGGHNTFFILGGVALAGLGFALASSGGKNVITPAIATTTTTS